MSERMPLKRLMAEWRDGDEHGWSTEFAWLHTYNAAAVSRLLADVKANGIREPILLGTDGRVWDGHHRIYVAALLNLEDVPVIYAQEDE